MFFGGRVSLKGIAKAQQEKACACTEQSEEERVAAEEMGALMGSRVLSYVFKDYKEGD